MMGKSDPAFAKSSRTGLTRDVHPVWRGIGCFMLILLPIISFAAAKLLVQENSRQRWVNVPQEMGISFSVPFVGQVLIADIALTIVLIVIGFGILTVVYAIFFRLIGPPRYGPLDSPPG